MNLFVDHREGKVLPLIQGVCEKMQPPVACEVVQLSLGDFLFVQGTAGVLIERKTSADFLSSIRSNRLWDQLLRFMKAETLSGCKLCRKLLLIHGAFDTLEHGDRFWAPLMGAYMETLFVYDIPIILAETDEAFTECMRIFIQREVSGKNDLLPQSRWFRKHCSADLPEMDKKRYILASVPSVGDVLAKNLINHFGSIAAVAGASEKQLQKVEGIGKVKAQKIHQIFH